MAKVQLCTSKDGIYSRVGGWIWIAIANFSSWKERKRRNTANIVSGTWKQSKASNLHAFLRPISLPLLYIFNVVGLSQVTLKLMINKGKIYTLPPLKASSRICLLCSGILTPDPLVWLSFSLTLFHSPPHCALWSSG